MASWVEYSIVIRAWYVRLKRLVRPPPRIRGEAPSQPLLPMGTVSWIGNDTGRNNDSQISNGSRTLSALATCDNLRTIIIVEWQQSLLAIGPGVRVLTSFVNLKNPFGINGSLLRLMQRYIRNEQD
jgi:hypothetical protein